MDLISTINAITLFFKTNTLALGSYLGLSTAPIAVQFAAIIALSIVSLIVIGAIGFGLYRLSSSFKKSPEEEEEIPSLEELTLPPAKANESLEYRAAIEALPGQQRGCMIAFEYNIPYKKILKKDNVSDEEFFDMVKDAKLKINKPKKG